MSTPEDLKEICLSKVKSGYVNACLPSGHKIIRMMLGRVKSTSGRYRDRIVVEYELNGENYRTILAGPNYVRS